MLLRSSAARAGLVLLRLFPAVVRSTRCRPPPAPRRPAGPRAVATMADASTSGGAAGGAAGAAAGAAPASNGGGPSKQGALVAAAAFAAPSPLIDIGVNLVDDAFDKARAC